MASVKAIGGPRPQVLNFQVGTSQSFKAGDLVKLVDGQLVIAETTNANLIADQPACHAGDTDSGTAGTHFADAEFIDPTVLYEMVTTTTLSIDCIGMGATTITYTLGAHTVALTDSDTAICWCVGLIDPVGSVGGRIIVKFNPAYVLEVLNHT